jgi:hypothetical protein
MEQSLLADHERQFATPHCARHKLLVADSTQATNRSSPRPAVLARREANSAGDALAHGRAAEPALRGMRLETLATAQAKELAMRQTQLRLRPAMSATRSTRPRATMAQPPPSTAKHSFEKLTGSPAAGGRTARLNSGEGHEPPLRLFTQTCEPPNVGHERRLEACEARWKPSARWKG